MGEYFSKFFNTSDFPPRWECGDWSAFLGWLHVLSDIGTFAAYFAIPLVLVYFIGKRKDIPFTRVVWLFAGFILACGLVHLIEAIIFWHPIYRISGMMKFFTAVLSWATVIALIRVVPKVLHLPSLAATNQRLAEREEQLRSLISSTAEGIYGIDLNGNCTFANEACAKLLGFESQEDLIGSQMHELIHHTKIDGSTYQNDDCQIYRAYRKGEKVHVDDEVFWRADGTSFDVEYWSYPQLRDGEIVGCVVTFLDTTQRKIGVREIAEKQAGLELALQAGQLGLWHWNVERDLVTWSNQLYELFGYTREQFDRTASGFINIVYAEDRQYVQSQLDKVLTGSCTEYEMEFRVVRGDDQRVLWTYGRGAIDRDEDGKPLSISAVASDITDRKRWEYELEDREADLRRVIDNMIGFVGVLDIDGTLREANQTVITGGGISREDVIGKPFWDCYWWSYDDQVVAELKAAVARAAAGEVVRYDVEVRMAGDSRMSIDFMLAPVRDAEGNVTHLIPSGMDISDRKKAEQETNQRERQLSLALEAGRLGSWVWDVPTHQIIWSDRLHEMYGYAKGEFKGTPEGFVEIVHPDDRPIVEKAIDSILNTDSVREDFECRSMRGTDGQIIWSQVHGDVDRDWQGNAIRITGFAVDITDRKRNELALAFFVDLELEMAGLSSADDIIRVASERVADYLQLSRCLLVAVDEEAVTAEVYHDHCRGGDETLNLCGVYNVGEFVTENERLQLKSGQPVVINDTAHESRDPGSIEQFAALKIGALIDAPCLHDHSLKFLLAAIKEQAYEWRKDEIDLMQELATRVYVRIERTRAEAALLESEQTLRESESQLQLGIEVANFAIGHIDYQQNSVQLSADAARLYGLGDDGLVVTREQIHSTFHPDDRDELADHIDNSLDPGGDGRISVEHRVICPDNQVRWLNVRKQVFFDPASDSARPSHAILAAQDITERKHSELAIKHSEQRLRIAAKAAGFGMLHADLENGTIALSPEARAIVGWADVEVDALRPDDVPEFVHPEDRVVYERHFKSAVLLPEGASESIDHRVVLPDGEIRWVRLNSAPLYSGDGVNRKATQLIGTMLDITRQRRFEQSLKEARDLAELANESKSEFLANMSHEIRTPMSAILGYADILQRHLKDPDNVNCVTVIRNNGRFLLDIINDILDLSKIEAGKLEIVRKTFRLQPWLAEIRSLMDVRASEKRVSLSIECDGKLPNRITADSKRLKQIMLNLIGNAIKFTESGTVRVVVRCDRNSDRTLLVIRVIDTGIGMTDEHIGKLFKAFSQADASVDRKFGGTGLGLAISQRLSQMMGGEISVESEIGKGSTFTVTIEIGLPDKVKFLTASDSLPRSPKPGQVVDLPEIDARILVVDDRRDIRFIAQHFIEDAGGTVVTGENGKQGIDLVHRATEEGTPFDLIVLDMQMPVMDGYEAARQLRASGYDKPIIALTAHAMESAREECLAAGCTDYISKPLDGPKFVQLLSDYLKRSRDRDNVASKSKAGTGELIRRKVLLIDDSRDACASLAMLLNMDGYETRTAGTASDGIEQAGTFLPDAVIMDLGLPDMSGFDALKKLKRNESLSNTLFIAATGQDSSEEIFDAGFHHYLQKPVSVSELERLLQRGS